MERTRIPDDIKLNDPDRYMKERIEELKRDKVPVGELRYHLALLEQMMDTAFEDAKRDHIEMMEKVLPRVYQDLVLNYWKDKYPDMRAIVLSREGRSGSRVKLNRDPKQAAKELIRRQWVEYQSGQAIYQSGAEFDRRMVAKYPLIKDTKTIQKWRGEWAKARSKSRVSGP